MKTKYHLLIKILKIICGREYGTKNFEVYVSNKQYQDAERGKLGGLNQKFFNLFKKAVTFTPIDDIEKFIVEYVCDVKNKIDINEMQENIRQYNSLSKQIEIMKIKQNELEAIEGIYANYVGEISKEREQQYLILRSEKEILSDSLEEIEKGIIENKSKKAELKEKIQDLNKELDTLNTECDELIETRAKSDIESKRKELSTKIKDLNDKLDNIDEKAKKDVNFFRNNNLKWNANIVKLEQIKNKIVADEMQELDHIKDTIKYLENINEENFETLEIEAIEEIKQKIQKLINLGNTVYYATEQEKMKDNEEEKNLKNDIDKLKSGIRPYDSTLISFKSEIQKKLKEKTGKDIEILILSDLLEVRDIKWQNAIEGYLNKQKNYLIIEPKYFEEASNIYRNLAKNNDKFHSFGIVDVEKIPVENNQIIKNSLAEEIITENELARRYINYLLGRVVKCETISELRNNKIAITSDCMLYQGFVLRRIDPKLYKYPSLGKKALEKQRELKEKELFNLQEKISNEKNILQIMGNVKMMTNFSENDIANFKEDIEQSKKKFDYIANKNTLQKELDGMDLLWLNNISSEIDTKKKLIKDKEGMIIEYSKQAEALRLDIERKEKEDGPKLTNELNEKNIEIEEQYSKEWQENVGEELFGKETLRKPVDKVKETFSRFLKSTQSKKEEIRIQLEDKKSNYNTKYQLSYNIHDGSNKEFSEELKKLKDIELPEYLEKIQDSRKKAYEQFRIEFLDKLKSNIDEVKTQIKELNSALGEHRFGTDSYSFKISPKQEYKRFYRMITDEMLLGDWGIGQDAFNEKYSEEIKELFDKVTTTDINSNAISDEEYEKNIKEYTDYRTYLNFDLIVKDKSGVEQRLSKTLLKKSGGETQTPFYISILASFAQVYRIKNNENTIRLIVFDEAFSKMDSERIEESIKLLKRIGFQAIFAAPPDKLQDIQSLVDNTLLVLNPDEYEIVVKKYANKKEW